MEENSKIVSLSLGSNLGDKENNLKIAIQNLEIQVGEVLKVSRFFKSKPWGFSSQNEFVNCCCMVRSSLSVDELMIAIQNIESRLGRQRIENDRYEDRVIDIDVIFFDNCIINKPNIRIPHKDFRKRDFVLLPLLNLANEIDPETFITISQFTK